ncbi:unnamed protein product [Penicillium discolor]
MIFMAILDYYEHRLADDTQGGTITIFLTVLLSIAFYNAAELTILIFLTFHRYSGLYFWSILLSTVLGIIPSTIGALLHYFSIGPLWLALSISTFAFWFVVPGQSVVLYSRLNLLLHNAKILRLILSLIIIDAVIILPTTIVLTFGSAYIQEHHWTTGYGVIERLEVTWFCVQELFISLVYIWETIKLLNLSPEKHSGRKRVMYELLALNLVVILMDIALLVTEYLGFLSVQIILKCFVYSIKLKLEFAVLGKLVIYDQEPPRPSYQCSR